VALTLALTCSQVQRFPKVDKSWDALTLYPNISSRVEFGNSKRQIWTKIIIRNCNSLHSLTEKDHIEKEFTLFTAIHSWHSFKHFKIQKFKFKGKRIIFYHLKYCLNNVLKNFNNLKTKQKYQLLISCWKLNVSHFRPMNTSYTFRNTV
jgi:hypothetical protein